MVLAGCFVCFAFGAASTAGHAFFSAAQPIWPVGLEREMNLFVGFRATVQPEKGTPVTVRVAASTLYRLFVNGEFRGQGPARAAHDFYRVDEWDITPLIHPGPNVIAFEVAGYNVNSYYVLDQPSFLQAEVVAGQQVLAATGSKRAPFEATLLSQRVRKVQRYSFQRPFIEVYRLENGWDRWRKDSSAALPQPAGCELVAAKHLIPRQVPYPSFSRRQPAQHGSWGMVRWVEEPGKLWKDRALTAIGPLLKGFPEKELEMTPSLDLQHYRLAAIGERSPSFAWTDKIRLNTNQFHILDFGTNLTGFLGVTVTCEKPVKLYLLFDETLTGGDVDFRRLNCVNAITYELEPGNYQLESFEPYTLRFLKLLVARGSCTISKPYLRELANPEAGRALFASSDERLNAIFEAGRETFRQNATDIFMDCPSRERAGWLCDSFFTARAGADLTGGTVVEHNFLENFLLPERFPHLPKGMLPMCYPADHPNGNFIPNWALWFVLQLEEYQARSGDRETVSRLRGRVMEVFRYFDGFENEDGLLEKLDKWVFVEWSAANKFVQDVNYPTNMLYAGALDAAARLYDAPELAAKAARVRDAVRRQSFDGEFFVDNAVRRNGKLKVTRNRTEVCQYFAFYFGVATPKTNAALWKTLVEKFGPNRVKEGLFPEIYPANAFIGNMLRMELLSRQARSRQIVAETRDYLLYMARRTGTLWENVDARASLNHGFASHAVHTLYRDVLGLYRVDPVKRRVKVRFVDSDLAWCEGRIPVSDGVVSLRWRKDHGRILYQLDVPAGYGVSLDNRSGKKVERVQLDRR